MKIYYASDLHLEFTKNDINLCNYFTYFEPEIDSILILAGDIGFISDYKKYLRA